MLMMSRSMAHDGKSRRPHVQDQAHAASSAAAKIKECEASLRRVR